MEKTIPYPLTNKLSNQFATLQISAGNVYMHSVREVIQHDNSAESVYMSPRHRPAHSHLRFQRRQQPEKQSGNYAIEQTPYPAAPVLFRIFFSANSNTFSLRYHSPDTKSQLPFLSCGSLRCAESIPPDADLHSAFAVPVPCLSRSHLSNRLD